MLVVARELRMNVKMCQQMTRMTRILGRDEVNFGEQTNGAVRHILEVADRRCREVQCPVIR